MLYNKIISKIFECFLIILIWRHCSALKVVKLKYFLFAVVARNPADKSGGLNETKLRKIWDKTDSKSASGLGLGTDSCPNKYSVP